MDPETRWPTPPRPQDQPQAPQTHLGTRTRLGQPVGLQPGAGACAGGDGWAAAEGAAGAAGVHALRLVGPARTPFSPGPSAPDGGAGRPCSTVRLRWPSGRRGGRARSPAGGAGRATWGRARGWGASAVSITTTECPEWTAPGHRLCEHAIARKFERLDVDVMTFRSLCVLARDRFCD